MPTAAIAALYQEIERLGGHMTPAKNPAPAGPPALRALLLFSRDGRLLASEGSIALDIAPFSALIARGETGTTWRLGHQAGIVVGHVGERAGLVAVFSAAPKSGVRSTLRASIASLEQKERLAQVLSHPASHATLMAYVRGVGALLRQHT